ncbi:LysR family transcriptional regulator [Paracoccus sp. (in: a-proteobacteria)]|uniref:LysR family transcriptional regulator n=1 Tax=Paracoccus sp. TaxID=267 RepID=UPI003A873017
MTKILHLRAVIAVTRAGSFRKAADRLHKSQPALTRAIAQFEEKIGLAIFERSPSGVTLTSAGERIHDRALSVIAALGRLEDEANQLRGKQLGTVRIGVSPVAGTTLLPGALVRFRRDWPGVQVDVMNSLYPDSLIQLREGLLDMVVGPVPTGRIDDAILVEPLFELQVVLVTHKAHPLRGARRMSDLAGVNWFIHGPAEGPSNLFHEVGQGVLAGAGMSLTRCHSLATLLELIVRCDGITFLSEPILQTYARQFGLVRIPVQDPLPRFNVAQLSRRGEAPTPAARDLMRFVLMQARAQRPAG